MSLRWKTVILFGASLLGLLLLSYVAVSTILMRGFLKQEEEDAIQNVKRIQEVVSDSLVTLDSKAWDWANWNEIYDFAENANPSFIETNFTDKTFSALKLNLALVVDRSNHLLYGKGFDLTQQRAMPVPDRLIESLSSSSPLLQHNAPDSSVKGLLGLPEGPMLVAARPILTSESTGPIRGTLIMGTFLNAEKIEYMARETRLDFSVEGLPLREPVARDDVQAALHSLLTRGVPVVIQALSENAVGGYCLLRDVSGAPIAVVRVLLARTIYQKGQETLDYLIASLVLIGLVYGAATLTLLETGILARVLGIIREIHEIGHKGSAGDRLLVAGADELSTLAGAINTMLEALEASQDGLRLANEKLEARVQERTRELAQANEFLRAENAERQKAEESLRRSEAKYRDLFMNAPVGIFQSSPEGTLLTVNPALAEALGYESSEALIHAIKDLGTQVHVDPAQREALLRLARHSNDQFRFEGHFSRKDGSTLIAEVQGRVARDGSGTLLRIEGFAEDITERKTLEEFLRQSRDSLEMLVEQRTAELNLKTQHLEEANAALKALLRQRDEDREEFEQAILSNVKNLVFPSLEKLRRSHLSGDQVACVETLESRIRQITSPFVRRLSQPFLGLTPTEIQVADLLRSGKTTKEIADNLCLSESTVLFHRNNLRTKLGLKGKKMNLRTYLQSFQ